MPEYRLLQPHSINRVVHPVGAIVTLPEQLGDGLKAEGKAESVIAARAAPAAAPAPRIEAPRNAVRAITQPTQRWKCCGQR